MSIWDWIRNRVKPTPRPAPPRPTPPAPPPIDPEYAKRRAEAMNRRAVDGLRYKKYQSDALSTGFLPPPPPSVDWYMNHPDYVWDPHQPNPERPPSPPKPVPTPTPIPQPTPADVETALSATKRWREDMDKWRKMSAGITNLSRPKSQPPSVTYYQAHPEYVWDPNAPQVR